MRRTKRDYIKTQQERSDATERDYRCNNSNAPLTCPCAACARSPLALLRALQRRRRSDVVGSCGRCTACRALCL
jgi:hypothetical protein